jgi:hypothetical protein
MKLRQASPADPVSAIGLMGLEEGAPILEDAEFYAKGGDQDRLEKEVDATGGTTITRALNAANTAITYTPDYTTLTKKIISRTIGVDDIVQQRGMDAQSELAKRDRREMRRAGRLLQNIFFNGDSGSVATDFDGFANLVDATRILSNGKVMPVGGDDVKDVQQEAIEQLIVDAEYCRAISGARLHAYMNPLLKIRLVTVAKNLGFYQSIQEAGKTFDTLLGDIILRSAGRDYNMAYLLPFTEAYVGANSSSIYFVAWGQEEGVTCLTSAGLVGKNDPAQNIFGEDTYNLDMTIGVTDVNALVRSTGWRLA